MLPPLYKKTTFVHEPYDMVYDRMYVLYIIVEVSVHAIALDLKATIHPYQLDGRCMYYDNEKNK